MSVKEVNIVCMTFAHESSWNLTLSNGEEENIVQKNNQWSHKHWCATVAETIVRDINFVLQSLLLKLL